MRIARAATNEQGSPSRRDGGSRLTGGTLHERFSPSSPVGLRVRRTCHSGRDFSAESSYRLLEPGLTDRRVSRPHGAGRGDAGDGIRSLRRRRSLPRTRACAGPISRSVTGTPPTRAHRGRGNLPRPRAPSRGAPTHRQYATPPPPGREARGLEEDLLPPAVGRSSEREAQRRSWSSVSAVGGTRNEASREVVRQPGLRGLATTTSLHSSRLCAISISKD